MRFICTSENREAWLQARKGFLGASDAAGILGLSKWSSPYSIWSDRVNGTSQEVTERMQWGSVLEAAILEESDNRFEAIDCRTIRKSGGMFASDEYPWAAATLDGTATLNGEEWPVECKNVDAFAAQEWEDGVPAYYVAQCQWQMMVTGAARVTVVALVGGNRWMWQDIPRDNDMIARLALEGALLWHRIETRDPPAVDGHEATTRALGQLESDGSMVELGNDATVLTYQYAEADEAYKRTKGIEEDAKSKRDAIGNQIRLMLGSAEVGQLGDGRIWQWKIEKKASYVVKASESRVLRLKNAPRAVKKGRAA